MKLIIHQKKALQESFNKNSRLVTLHHGDLVEIGITVMSHKLWAITSVTPFQSKNRDKIYLDAPNLKKGCDRDFRATCLTYKQWNGFIGWKIQESSNKISSAKFYSSCMVHTVWNLPSNKHGYIDVGDGCWRRNVLVTITRWWWRFWPSEFSHQHPQIVSNITVTISMNLCLHS